MLSADDYNNTSFALRITEEFRRMKADKILKLHQQAVVKYMERAHGILVQHDLGTGKSLIAAAILASELAKSRHVIFLSAKTLHGNMEKAINEYKSLSEELEKMGTNYNFITMNASNMLDQFRSLDKVASLDTKFATVAKVDLDNRTLIVDEAHNLFNSIVNGSRNALGLYHAVMSAKNCKVIFMSGTPIVNHPFELVPCYNMIAKKEVLPSIWDDFTSFFINYRERRIINKAKFQDRITGLTSYYGAFYGASYKFRNDSSEKIIKRADVTIADLEPEVIKRADFPTKYRLQVIDCPMSDYQFQQYSLARDKEIHETKATDKRIPVLQKPRGLFSTSYRRLSRQYSNFVFPLRAIETYKERVVLHPDKIIEEDLHQLSKYSPKIEKLLENLKLKGKHLIYSSFVENSGINILAKIMKLNGWLEHDVNGIEVPFNDLRTSRKKTRINADDNADEEDNIVVNDNADDNIVVDDNADDNADDNIVDDDNVVVKKRSKKGGRVSKKTKTPIEKNKANIFIRITGDVVSESRQGLVNTFNAESNKYGDEIKVIIISGAGAEGLDLKCVRNVHLLEPYWNYMRISQTIGRAVRYKSHEQLPESERDVHSFIYIASYPKKIEAKNPLLLSEETTDNHLYKGAISMQMIINTFYVAMAEASIDCTIHNRNEKLKCRLCSPTDQKLYQEDIYTDIKTQSPCLLAKTERVKAKEIEVDGKKFAYMKEEGKMTIMEYRDDLGGYRIIGKDHPLYAEIYNKYN